MKRLVLALLLIWAQLVLSCAYAATSSDIYISVAIGHTLSVYVDAQEIDLGMVSLGSESISQSGITVKNDGSGAHETYVLSLDNPNGWTAATASGMDQYVLMAAFSQQASGVSWSSDNHLLAQIPASCSAIRFAGDQSGADVAYEAQRKLWFKFIAPTATSVAGEQRIKVTVSAELAR